MKKELLLVANIYVNVLNTFKFFRINFGMSDSLVIFEELKHYLWYGNNISID